MPTIDIPSFNIDKVEIHKIPIWKTDVQTLINISKPIVNIPGCVRVHRNNLTSLIDSDKDEYGTYTECGNFSIPSFEPLEYNPNEFKYTQAKASNQTEEFVPPTVEPPKYTPRKDKDKILFVECPGPNDQRVGQYASEFKLERVIGHERSEDGSKCITLYEDVKFIEQYIPNPPQLISTAVIAAVAATTPLLLNIVKPLIKNIIKKLSKKKDTSS
tara:strand:- start:58 stop:702 length:645 start_codon:yes stop_codon:yes gene_type:complete